MKELTLNCSGIYEDEEGVSASAEVSNLILTLGEKKVLKGRQTVGLTAEPVILGDIETRGWLILQNKDPLNEVTVRMSAATTGNAVGVMKPGEPYGPVRLGPDMQQPHLQADTAECDVDVFLTGA